jgi:hypothetical protein
MIITNNLGLPRAFVEMAKRDYEYEPNEYRVTSLLKGVREAILERRHDKEIEQDVSDMIWLLFGTAVHSILEQQQEGDHEIKETRIKIPFGKYILSGQFDLYNAETKTITDYKTASVWKIIFKNYDDWRRQLLIYAYMMRSIGFDVRNGEIVALLKDHSKRDAKVKPDYPQLPVKRIVFYFSEKDFAEIETWLISRFAEIAEAEKLPDDELPLCTPEERFNSGDKYAVMKGKNKRAMRVLDSMEEAEEWMKANGGTHIDIRPGEDKKCIDYCSVCEFCNHYRENVAKEEIRKEA